MVYHYLSDSARAGLSNDTIVVHKISLIYYMRMTSLLETPNELQSTLKICLITVMYGVYASIK